MSAYDSILFAILVFFMILGFLRGLLKEIAALLLIVVPIFAAMLLSPFLADFLQKNTKVSMTIEQVLNEKIKVTAEETSKVEEISKEREAESQTDHSKRRNPKELTGYLKVFMEKPKEGLNEEAVGGITARMVEALAFVIVYGIFYLGISILYFTLSVITKLPVLSGFNRFFGAILGLCKALLLVSVFLLILPVLYVNVKGTDVILEGIGKSAVLKHLYENNIIITLWRLIF